MGDADAASDRASERERESTRARERDWGKRKDVGEAGEPWSSGVWDSSKCGGERERKPWHCSSYIPVPTCLGM